MIFLKNKREWKTWLKAENIENADMPKVFPCFGYAVVGSFSYEEYAAAYLYPDDLAEMVSKIMHHVGIPNET
jgi:hypothetical protein